MKNLQIKTNPEVEMVFNKYPDSIRKKMLDLRALIIATATEIHDITSLEETLRWGEPSYLTKYGSTIRMDWKPKNPDQYAMYFQCTSRLVPTFKIFFKNTFEFEGKRAIIFQIEDKVPKEELQYCIKAALMYHKVKNQPTLGL